MDPALPDDTPLEAQHDDGDVTMEHALPNDTAPPVDEAPQHDDDVSMDSAPPKLSRQEILESIRLPKATRVTAKNLHDISFTHTYLKTRAKVMEHKHREQRKKKPPDGLSLQEALDAVSAPENSLMHARSIQDVDRISTVRRDAGEPFRELRQHPRLRRLKYTQTLRKKRAKKRVASKVKRSIKEHAIAIHPDSSSDSSVHPMDGWCSSCKVHHPLASRGPKGERAQFTYSTSCPRAGLNVACVTAYGAAGSCIGSRLGGHLKWGGKWIRRELLLMNILVAVTDEYCTSQFCPFCFSRIQLSRSRRLVGTTIRTKTIHGSVECRNPACIAFQCGYGTRPRDTNAAINILISAMSIMDSGGPWPIAPFCRYIRPSNVPTTTASRPALEDPQSREHSSGVPSQLQLGVDRHESTYKARINDGKQRAI